MDLQQKYIDEVNKILPMINLSHLDQSCNGVNNSYAKEVLKKLHDAFVSVYGTDYLDRGEYEFVELPALIRGQNTGHIALGIVTIDLESSGEHWGTSFITPQGVLEQSDENLSELNRAYIRDTLIPYEYWYSIDVENDIHVDFENIPEKVADILNTCRLDQAELSKTDIDFNM